MAVEWATKLKYTVLVFEYTIDTSTYGSLLWLVFNVN